MAKAYGWTQREIDTTDAELLDWLVAIQGIEHELQEEAAKKQERQMRQQQMRGHKHRRT